MCGSHLGSTFPCLPLACLAKLIPAFLHSLDLTGERPSRAWKAFVTRAGIWAGCWAALRLGLSLQHPDVGQKRSFEYESEQLLEAALQWGKYKDKEGGVK